MRSLNEPSEEEEEEEGIRWAEEEVGSLASIQKRRCAVAVLEKQRPALQANSLGCRGSELDEAEERALLLEDAASN